MTQLDRIERILVALSGHLGVKVDDVIQDTVSKITFPASLTGGDKPTELQEHEYKGLINAYFEDLPDRRIYRNLPSDDPDARFTDNATKTRCERLIRKKGNLNYKTGEIITTKKKFRIPEYILGEGITFNQFHGDVNNIHKKKTPHYKVRVKKDEVSVLCKTTHNTKSDNDKRRLIDHFDKQKIYEFYSIYEVGRKLIIGVTGHHEHEILFDREDEGFVKDEGVYGEGTAEIEIFKV